MSAETPSSVPFIALDRLHSPLRQAMLEAVARVVDSGVFIGGPEVEALEQELAQRLGVRHAVGVSSGTDALLVSLMALGVGPGDEVITTPMSFFATAGSIARLGARPVFADIDPATYTLDPAQVQRALTPQTRAIVPVHLFGQLAPMGALRALADAHGVALVEDAAQAIGASGPQGRAGALGELGCFSFFPTKNLGALGDGGLVTTQDDALAARVRALGRHGAQGKYHHPMLGGNFRLDAMQAALLRVKLPHLERWQARRRELAARYDQALATRAELTLPWVRPGHHHTFHQYVVRLPSASQRDALRARLSRAGVETMIYYPQPLHVQPCFQALGYRDQDCPQATRACEQVLALPIWPGLTDQEQERVITALEQALEEA